MAYWAFDEWVPIKPVGSDLDDRSASTNQVADERVGIAHCHRNVTMLSVR